MGPVLFTHHIGNPWHLAVVQDRSRVVIHEVYPLEVWLGSLLQRKDPGQCEEVVLMHKVDMVHRHRMGSMEWVCHQTELPV
jgi:hypothetical protein